MLLSRAATVATVAILTLAGCPSDPVCHIIPPGSGSATNMPDAVILVGAQDGTLIEVHDGIMVPLIRPLQGGQILLAGAKLNGSVDCALDATGDLRDPATNRVIGLDERPALLSPASDGWSVPSVPAISSMPNIAVCPTSATAMSIDGNPFTLEITIRDHQAVVAMLSATVIPTCGTDPSCHAECTP